MGTDTSTTAGQPTSRQMHDHVGFGLPYAPSRVAADGRYAVVCPACGAVCAGPADGDEDAATKGANAAYADHYAAERDAGR